MFEFQLNQNSTHTNMSSLRRTIFISSSSMSLIKNAKEFEKNMVRWDA